MIDDSGRMAYEGRGPEYEEYCEEPVYTYEENEQQLRRHPEVNGQRREAYLTYAQAEALEHSAHPHNPQRTQHTREAHSTHQQWGAGHPPPPAQEYRRSYAEFVAGGEGREVYEQGGYTQGRPTQYYDEPAPLRLTYEEAQRRRISYEDAGRNSPAYAVRSRPVDPQPLQADTAPQARFDYHPRQEQRRPAPLYGPSGGYRGEEHHNPYSESGPTHAGMSYSSAPPPHQHVQRQVRSAPLTTGPDEEYGWNRPTQRSYTWTRTSTEDMDTDDWDPRAQRDRLPPNIDPRVRAKPQHTGRPQPYPRGDLPQGLQENPNHVRMCRSWPAQPVAVAEEGGDPSLWDREAVHPAHRQPPSNTQSRSRRPSGADRQWSGGQVTGPLYSAPASWGRADGYDGPQQQHEPQPPPRRQVGSQYGYQNDEMMPQAPPTPQQQQYWPPPTPTYSSQQQQQQTPAQAGAGAKDYIADLDSLQEELEAAPLAQAPKQSATLPPKSRSWTLVQVEYDKAAHKYTIRNVDSESVERSNAEKAEKQNAQAPWPKEKWSPPVPVSTGMDTT